MSWFLSLNQKVYQDQIYDMPYKVKNQNCFSHCYCCFSPLGDIANCGVRLRLWLIPGRWLMLETMKALVRVWGYDNKLEIL